MTDREHALVDDNLVYGLNERGYNAWTAQVWDETGARQSRAEELGRRWNTHADLLDALRDLVNERDNFGGAPNSSPAWDAARAAIQKATGEGGER